MNVFDREYICKKFIQIVIFFSLICADLVTRQRLMLNKKQTNLQVAHTKKSNTKKS